MTQPEASRPTPEYLAAVGSPQDRTHKLFRLIDQPFDPPDEVQQRSREFIAQLRWTYATTAPYAPHEYVVRARLHPGLRDAYDTLWRDTHAHGYRGRFARTVHWYMTVDSFRYWSCSLTDCGPAATDRPCAHRRLAVGCVVNRALTDDQPPAQLRLDMEGLR